MGKKDKKILLLSLLLLILFALEIFILIYAHNQRMDELKSLSFEKYQQIPQISNISHDLYEIEMELSMVNYYKAKYK